MPETHMLSHTHKHTHTHTHTHTDAMRGVGGHECVCVCVCVCEGALDVDGLQMQTNDQQMTIPVIEGPPSPQARTHTHTHTDTHPPSGNISASVCVCMLSIKGEWKEGESRVSHLSVRGERAVERAWQPQRERKVLHAASLSFFPPAADFSALCLLELLRQSGHNEYHGAGAKYKKRPQCV